MQWVPCEKNRKNNSGQSSSQYNLEYPDIILIINMLFLLLQLANNLKSGGSQVGTESKLEEWTLYVSQRTHFNLPSYTILIY